MNDTAVTVNREQCLKIASIVRELEYVEAFYNREYLVLKLDREILFRMHFFAVAICHYTYSLHHPVLDLWGWDYIEHVFVKLAKENSPILDPHFLAMVSENELEKILATSFSHTGLTEHTTLDRLHERTHLMQDAAKILVKRWTGKITELFDDSKGFLIDGGNGLYETLPGFEAFSDPLQKKSTFLIKLLMDAELFAIKDPERFIPIMDYHMQRALLRTGCVEVNDEKLRDQLIHREESPGDEPVRSRCIEAFRIIAAESGKAVTRMNDYFWSLGRSCCNEKPLCGEGACEKSPCTLSQIIRVGDHNRCVFQDVCPGATDEAYRRLWQPVVVTHYY